MDVIRDSQGLGALQCLLAMLGEHVVASESGHEGIMGEQKGRRSGR